LIVSHELVEAQREIGAAMTFVETVPEEEATCNG
jgi:hypothetical protein